MSRSNAKLKHLPRKPFAQRVSKEQLLAFEPLRPETTTGVPLLDAFMEALTQVRAISLLEIAYYLDVDGHNLSCALELYTGMKFNDFKREYFLHKIKMWRRINPNIEEKEIAQRLGYKDYTGLWNFLHPKTHEKYRKFLKQMKERIYKNH